ncbi:hypothetical protein ACQJBY_069500 [Aegilops geniculata]
MPAGKATLGFFSLAALSRSKTPTPFSPHLPTLQDPTASSSTDAMASPRSHDRSDVRDPVLDMVFNAASADNLSLFKALVMMLDMGRGCPKEAIEELGWKMMRRLKVSVRCTSRPVQGVWRCAGTSSRSC